MQNFEESMNFTVQFIYIYILNTIVQIKKKLNFFLNIFKYVQSTRLKSLYQAIRIYAKN